MSKLVRDGRATFVALRLGSVALPMFAAIVWGLMAWRAEMKDTRSHAVASAELVAQYAERMIETQRLLQDAAKARLEGLTGEEIRGEGVHRFLRDLDAGMPMMHGMLLVAADGEVIASSRKWPVDMRLTGRSYVDAVAGGAETFIDRLILQPDGIDAMVLATALERDGRRMLLVSSVDSSVAQEFLRGIVIRDGDAASLMREDGMLLIRNFDAPPMMLPEDARIRQEMRKAERGSFSTVAASDGIERVYAYHKLENLPLYANFGTPTRIVLVDWLRRAAPVWVMLGALSGLLLLAVLRAQRRLGEVLELEAGRRRVEAAERMAEERTHLMRETNHRVKNNLALVVSLINMQMRGKSGIDGNQLKARIGAISRVHDLMYRAADGVHVDFAHTLRELAESPAIVPQERGISVDCRAEPGIVLGPDQLTPLAVIAAELLTNAVKHAFAGREAGVIHVRLHRMDGEGVLEVSDDGVGLPDAPQRRSGMAIVDALVGQIGGSIERISGAGAMMRVRFPLPAG
ncbi:hypothetical protein GU927_004555 [Rhodobacteraceae bacterium HSP-20]|uniref:histidine kinase n=1 Tax=Paragemmobacter amnigenus TaxID=2852097 RepID=A0ABS6J038_9RHOB|nr:hypothetical protein [Rhodobacter amnigenus]MBV4388342.1 hypothetical protein [Rhodobacter amnigenus]